ncbi:uncharacterized protein LOC122507850 [Leptopilina heterotoma]|uniref:uncharacterized protein LOC122507850 n=1 Tax=Leptopilina heterotoma TaxID=63436 RepID=UPI001CA9F31C|nr:uncharacterized protein LOC122507850 [Leptopilina heterotoma]
MADVAAKREARRRKILENSQNRLEKITGRVCDSPLERNGLSENRKGLFDFLADGTTQDDGGLDNRLYPRVQGDFENSDNPRDSPPLSENSLIYKLLFGKLSYPLLALIVNILFVLKLEDYFGQTIYVPYFALIVVHIIYHQRWSKLQGSNMLVAVLLLCNMNPKVINRLIKIITILKLIFQGLSLYVLSYSIMRWIISFVWNEFDDPSFENLNLPDMN